MFATNELGSEQIAGVAVETFIPLKTLVDNPAFGEQRLRAIGQLQAVTIDAPMGTIINGFAKLPYCFTLQCCFGHFLYGDQKDRENLGRLPLCACNDPVHYRIAYVALCVDYCDRGASLVSDLKQITRVDHAYLQFGCATWFWRRHVNSYALQIEPERYQTRDSVTVDYQEALHLQRVRDECFSDLAGVVDSHVQML